MKLDNKGFALTASVLTTFVSVTLAIAIFIIIFPILWEAFGFSPVELPSELVSIIEKIDYIAYLVGYFFPIDFIGICILIVLIARNANIFLSLIDYVIKKIGGN